MCKRAAQMNRGGFAGIICRVMLRVRNDAGNGCDVDDVARVALVALVLLSNMNQLWQERSGHEIDLRNVRPIDLFPFFKACVIGIEHILHFPIKVSILPCLCTTLLNTFSECHFMRNRKLTVFEDRTSSRLEHHAGFH